MFDPDLRSAEKLGKMPKLTLACLLFLLPPVDGADERRVQWDLVFQVAKCFNFNLFWIVASWDAERDDAESKPI